jgi:peptidoglycan/LPS O-acetylase OafA/YrhL
MPPFLARLLPFLIVVLGIAAVLFGGYAFAKHPGQAKWGWLTALCVAVLLVIAALLNRTS